MCHSGRKAGSCKSHVVALGVVCILITLHFPPQGMERWGGKRQTVSERTNNNTLLKCKAKSAHV